MSALKKHVVERGSMPIDAFRAFQADRPDEESWELIDGVPIMMTPAMLGHARIASNIERLLSDALDAFDLTRIALHDIGVDLGLASETLAGLGRGDLYAPQPDVGVINAVFGPDQSFATRLYVAVEVVSDTDRDWIASVGMPWIEAKTRIYQAHRHCEAVVVVEQRRVEVRLAVRTGAGWTSAVLTDLEDGFALPTCGLARSLSDLYRGTLLSPKRGGV